MEQYILDCINKYQISKQEKIVVGVSTGIDSMVLLHALEKVIPSSQIIVAHINHQKRAQSVEEEAFICQYAKDHGLEIQVKRLESKQKANFQEMARKFRLDFFQDVMESNDAHILFLAHHLDDDAENFFIRLLRGSSLRSLAGMNQLTEVSFGKIIRPFLGVSKEQIKEYARKEAISFYEDESNQQNVYTRNRIRNQIIPLLKKENPLFLEQFASLKQDILELANWLDAMRDQWITQNVFRKKDSFSFSKKEFQTNKMVLKREILFGLLKQFQLSKATIDEIIKLIESEEANLKVSMNGFTFLKEYDQISFLFSEQENKEFFITLSKEGEYLINDKQKIIIRKNNHKNSANPANIWYNSDKLPITARSRQAGDKMHFEYGTKKVKRILIDRKIPLSQREQVIVLEKDDEIIALLGLAVSSKYTANENSDILIELKEI